MRSDVSQEPANVKIEAWFLELNHWSDRQHNRKLQISFHRPHHRHRKWWVEMSHLWVVSARRGSSYPRADSQSLATRWTPSVRSWRSQLTFISVERKASAEILNESIYFCHTFKSLCWSDFRLFSLFSPGKQINLPDVRHSKFFRNAQLYNPLLDVYYFR